MQENIPAVGHAFKLTFTGDTLDEQARQWLKCIHVFPFQSCLKWRHWTETICKNYIIERPITKIFRKYWNVSESFGKHNLSWKRSLLVNTYGAVKFNKVGWPWKAKMQWRRSDVIVSRRKSRNVCISVNGSKFRGWKQDFGENSAGRCFSYDVISSWPGQTRTIYVLVKSCVKAAPVHH